MRETEYSRRLDSSGRLVIPSKLREELRMEVGDEYAFFIQE
jgi:bifunctional DNA-binding transcriptional regulator/antitoxin component of YhaV-PrlF toxin-antitoxin module